VLAPVELIASKTYFASGVVIVVIYFGGIFFVVVTDGANEQPLLDSKFPDVSSKGRGYQVNTYGDGVAGWPGLRKVSVWQTSKAMEAEMEARLGKEGAEKTAAGLKGAPVLSTSEAVDAMERQAKASQPPEESGGGGDGDGDGGGAKATASPAAAEAKAAGGTGAADAKSGQGDAPATAEAKDGPGGGLGGHGAGLGDAARSQRQSLGAFHRLAPLGGVAGQLEKIRAGLPEGVTAAPWDASGRPVALGKGGLGGGVGSPFGKAPLDFKKSPGGL